MAELLFTRAAVLDLLTQIEELKEYDLGITDTMDGKVQIQVGDSVYQISDETAEPLPVDDNVVAQVEDINLEAYEELANEGVIDLDVPMVTDSSDFGEVFIGDAEDEYVESGILSTLAKALAIGGLVMVGKNLITK